MADGLGGHDDVTCIVADVDVTCIVADVVVTCIVADVVPADVRVTAL